MSMNMYNSRVSVGSGHAHDRFTDQLYEPLRKTFLEDTTAKKPILYEAAKVSKVSKQLSPRRFANNHQIMENTLIPQYARLKKCDNISQISWNKNYCIVNAQRKRLDPITPEELEQRLKGKKFSQEVIVYSYGEEEPGQQNFFKNAQTNKYEASKIARHEKKKEKQTQYNLFSIFDEGINNLLAGKSFTFPSNQIIASRPNKNRWNIDN